MVGGSKPGTWRKSQTLPHLSPDSSSSFSLRSKKMRNSNRCCCRKRLNFRRIARPTRRWPPTLSSRSKRTRRRWFMSRPEFVKLNRCSPMPRMSKLTPPPPYLVKKQWGGDKGPATPYRYLICKLCHCHTTYNLVF